MDRVSFSDDTDDSFPSQNLRETIDDMSRRLEFDSLIEMTEPRYFPTECQEARGAPDGHTTSVLTAPTLNSGPLTSQDFSTSSPTTKRQEESVPCIASDEPVDLCIASDEPVDFCTTSDEPVDLCVVSDERVDLCIDADAPVDLCIDSDEPVDLSNGPLDLRTGTKRMEGDNFSSTCDSIMASTSSSQFHVEKTVDSFDSILLLPKNESYISPRVDISLNLTVSSTHSLGTVDGLVSSKEQAKGSNDITFAISSTDLVIPISNETKFVSDPNSTEIHGAECSTFNVSDNISAMETGSLCYNGNTMNPIISNEIARTVESIVSANDSSPSTYSSNSSRECERLNETYNLRDLSQNARELIDVLDQPDGASITLDDTALLPIEVEPDSALVNEGASASCFVTGKPNEASSSFVSETFLDNTCNTTWSVKKALTCRAVSPGSSLKLTLTRSPPNNTPRKTISQVQFQDLNTFPVLLDVDLTAERSVDSAHNRRDIAGSSSYSEESTICSESSQVVPFACYPIPSCPRTPDLTLCPSPRYAQESPLRTFPVAFVGETSTPNDKLDPGHSIRRSAPKSARKIPKDESPRTRLLRRALDTQGSDSVLNTGFRDDSTSSRRKKNKKKSLLKNIKRQILCSKETNVSIATFVHKSETYHQKPSSRTSQTTQTKAKRAGQQIFSKLKPCANLQGCINVRNMDDTCPTTLFATISDSSTGLTSWCKYIRDITQIPNNPEQVVPVFEGNTTTTPAGTGLRSSTKYEADTTPNSHRSNKNRRDSTSTALFGHLQPSVNPHSGGKATISSTCVGEGTFKKPKKVTAEHRQRNESPRNFKTPEKFNHLQSVPSLHMKPEASDGVFKKPAAPSKKRIAFSKSAPALSATATDVKQTKGPIKPSGSRRMAASNPLSSSTPTATKPVKRRQEFLHPGQGHDTSDRWMIEELNCLDTSDVRIKLISEVGRQTAEWLATFVGDASTKRHQMRCDEQPNRSVLLQLCARCKIRVQWPGSDSCVLRLKKTKETRAPTESDVRHLVRAIRRKKESVLL